MKYLSGFLMSVAVLVISLIGFAFGQQNGTILFSGMVIEEPCYIFKDRHSLTGKCIQNQQIESVNINTKDIGYGKEVSLPYNMGKMSIKPAADSDKAAIVTVTYL